jgi:ABC-2 type transport system permease protein
VKTLLAKELRERWRTWRLVILLAVLAVSGLISPLLAYYTPDLLRLVPNLPPELANLIPTPSLADAVTQYVKNVTQFGVLLVVLLTMGAIAQEKERGTAAMLLVRPVPRAALVLAKWLASTATLVAGVLLAGFFCWAYTALLFEPLPVLPFALLNLLLVVFMETYLSVTLLASTLAATQGAAAGLAFGGMAVLLILSSLPRIGDFLPGRLPSWGTALVLQQEQTSWPALGIALALIAVSLSLACWSFARQEI